MNGLYITLFFNIPALSKHLLSLGTSFCIPESNISPSFREFTAPLHHILPIHNVTTNRNNLFVNFRWIHLLHWEIIWRNAPRIWRDFGSALPFQTRLTQTKPVLPLSNEHGSQVKDQGRWQCCHNKNKKSPYRPTCDESLLSRHASYPQISDFSQNISCFVYHSVLNFKL